MDRSVVRRSADDRVVENQRFGNVALAMMLNGTRKKRGKSGGVICSRQARSPGIADLLAAPQFASLGATCAGLSLTDCTSCITPVPRLRR
jgi:hypothetical protein